MVDHLQAQAQPSHNRLNHKGRGEPEHIPREIAHGEVSRPIARPVSHHQSPG